MTKHHQLNMQASGLAYYVRRIMNPYKLKDVFKYLTSNNQLLKKKLKLGTSEIPIPPKRQDVIDVEVINRFTKA